MYHMSRLKRSTFRLQKATDIMESIENGAEDQRPLELANTLVRIAQDIPLKKLEKPKPPWSNEWQTLAIIARIACLAGHVDITTCDVEDYIPKHVTDSQIQNIYEHIQKGDLKSMIQIMIDRPLLVC